ncbi:HEXXH motif domain-containing protein [Streptomyces sp. SL13]|uniref:HEXXH motif domain-containing protein n=1 Tax=Streptantibioticus silvisoli TaxID=2705255 RepID=A0AA90K7E0_9ACTN|nr:HEXXH motif domain-containing protein [Streptantibioticus silvisoli]MDI5968818.1 HEXXH motif domain-containing protein [Streptantibioticus silvisoli]
MSRTDPAAPGGPRPHAVTAPMFGRLARGDGGADAMRVLADAEYSRRLVMLWAVRRAAMRHSGDVERRGRTAWDVLTAAQHRSPAAVRALIAYPSVGPLLLRTLNALTAPAGPPDTTRTGPDPLHALTCLAAAAAVTTGLEARVSLIVCGRRIVLPGVGAVHPPALPCGTRAVVEAGPAGAHVTVDRQRIALSREPSRTAGAWQGLRILLPGDGPGEDLAFDDIDPYHTGISGRCGRLPEALWQRWRHNVTAGWRLLRAEHTGAADEAAVVFRALVPLAGPAGSRRSSSSKETFGAAALTLPDTTHGMALTLTHELQHNKLSALLHLFDLVAEQPGELFYAPWREDPRPLVGLLHGTYAHLGVARFWQRRSMRLTGADRHEAEVQFARWRGGAVEAAETLIASGRLTGDGMSFVAGMHAALEELADAPVSATATAEGAVRAAAHRRQWTARHGALLPGGRPR